MAWLTALLVAVGIAMPVAQTSGGAMSADAVKRRLVGTWTLVKYEVFDERGGARPGNYDTGRLIYDEQGEMAAHLMRSGRPKEAPTTEAARASAYQSYLGYFGPYTIDPDQRIVVHHVAGSSLPHWIGTEQIRYYGFSEDGKYLTLSLKSGERVTQTLTWDRVR
jgi:hypothetical protein